MFLRLLILFILYRIVHSTENYGLMKLTVKKLEACKGPKRVDCCIPTLKVKSPNTIIIQLNVTQPVQLTHGKIVGYSNGKEVLKIPMKKPCDSMVVNLVLRQFLNASENCSVKKGSFDLLITKFELCKGPKRNDCTVAKASISKQNCLDYDIDIKENVRPTKGKINVFSKGKETLRLQVKDPCQHLFLKPLFQSILNVTNDCLMIKGHYRFNVDIQDVARKYYGGEFLYGNWTFKSVFFNDACNFSCSVLDVSMVPKNTTKI